MKWVFIVFFVFLGSLFFRAQQVPSSWVESIFAEYAPTNLVLHVDSLSFGFHYGLTVEGFRLYDREKANPLEILAGADHIAVDFLRRRVCIDGAKYLRLPDSYYAPGNEERNARVEGELPELGRFSLVLNHPDILAVRPLRVTAEVDVRRDGVFFDRIHLDWPDQDEEHMSIDGSCYVDLSRQVVEGKIDGLAKQPHIRPLLVALDVPVSLPYFDGFTEVPGPVPSTCGWHVNLINNDFDLDLGLHPTMGKYNTVSMKKADGNIHLHVYTRGTSLNYRQTIGPIIAVGLKDQPLEGTVIVSGTNGYNCVEVTAKSGLPVADILKIGGFTGDYVGDEVFGDSKCQLEFRFPRAMTNNYEVLDGKGHLTIKNGQLMRMKGFKGLIEAMPAIAPAVSWFSDTTQASCDYVIEKGVLKTDNIYVEGTLFSIKMYGQFDAVKNEMDFTVRVQFTKKDSLLGKLLHPLTWPFTKLLLEFKLTGTPEDTKWNYISVIDRVLEVAK